MLSVDFEKRLDRDTLKVSLQCDSQCVALFGASGAGKSMTLKCIAGLEKPDKGVIKLNGRTLFDSAHRINLSPQKRRVGYLFQDYALFPNMTVQGNIEAGLHAVPKKERSVKAKELIRRFHLDGLEKIRSDKLSGGEKQRVALARIIASAPEAILLDEPFSSLDTLLKLELIPSVKEIITRFSGDMLLVSHDIDEVRQLCADTYPITEGSVGDPEPTESYYQKLKERYRNLK